MASTEELLQLFLFYNLFYLKKIVIETKANITEVAVYIWPNIYSPDKKASA